ncbi:hypothetical protein PSEUBRA_002729 [Kalmanozyma brasiliensis GHG001]|uniref:uncharacterized protein n=1 Tax=Kalmanozyma brasiliensis (strain GHG001) TaxID=1365824 RepID=UPI002867BA6B|nr:uncharacterized protein PSEUBRA_002729 [Kalmanozyma brasiliensis GHG001]KAF6767122.1 hypothetical protein PSEUBRA_002729 [Kalmanozyma brasiliensis GHG001]
MESRAARFRPSDPQSSAGTLAPAAVSKLPELANVDDVPTWPARDENPKALAYNLKVAFAARQGDWVKVEELLDNADLLSSAPTKPNRDHRGTPKRRSGMTLDAIGWGSLLRHGLGNVQKLDVAGLSTAAGADASSEEPRSRSHDLTASTHPNDQSSDDPDDKLKKAKEEAQQMQAKLSVTKRLLPNLLRSMSRSASVARSSNLAGDESKAPAEVAESSTPSWLLQSVLAQLAERGETASAIRIVQLALSEASPSLGNNAADRRTATHVLNLALQACGHNGRIRIAETLRIFNSLTSSQLGHDISGSTVLIQPRVLSDFKKPREDAKNELTSVIVPNEESLVLLLKKVCHPLFRASWTRRLVDDFERLFPQVSVSGRTFRMILANCLAPAPAPALAGVPASMPAVRERVVASGRRGRRLRQAAATNNTASASPDVTVATAREPRLKVSILSQTLETILTRFAHFTAAHDPSRRLHLSTTNRLRFEHTLLRAKRMLLVKRAAHQEALRSIAAVGKRKRMTTHHTHAITQINIALDRIAAVQRLGRCEEAHWKRHARTSTADQR